MAVRYQTSLRWLLEHGANPNTRLEVITMGSVTQPRTAMALASRLSDPSPLELLLSFGAEMDPDAIFYAIGNRRQNNGTATLKVLLDNGADVNFVSRHWCTPLHRASRGNQPEELKLLLEYGADPNFKPLNWNFSALERAKQDGRTEMYEIMKTALDKEGL
jgi:ankyrin repeat protein